MWPSPLVSTSSLVNLQCVSPKRIARRRASQQGRRSIWRVRCPSASVPHHEEAEAQGGGLVVYVMSLSPPRVEYWRVRASYVGHDSSAENLPPIRHHWTRARPSRTFPFISTPSLVKLHFGLQRVRPHSQPPSGRTPKSRETSAESHSLTGTMNEIHETFGGNLVRNIILSSHYIHSNWSFL